MKEQNRENAAKTIQNFWQRAKSKLLKDLSLYAKAFKAATTSDIKDGKNDAAIFNCINHCAVRNNRAGLQLIAYSLFSGPAVNHNGFYSELTELQFILYVLFRDETSNARDIGVVLKDTYLKWQSIVKTSIPNTLKQEEKKEGFWRGLDGKNDNKELSVNISHGGGLFYIMDFLRGRSQGYSLEYNGLGLQVSPNDSSRDFSYAVRKSRYHFDRPAIFSARIPAGYLTSAVRPYEAGLRPESLPALRDIEITAVSENALQKLWLCRIDVESIHKHYADNAELKDRILNSVNILKQQDIISVTHATNKIQRKY